MIIRRPCTDKGSAEKSKSLGPGPNSAQSQVSRMDSGPLTQRNHPRPLRHNGSIEHWHPTSDGRFSEPPVAPRLRQSTGSQHLEPQT